MHFRKNGDGDYSISKGAIALTIFIITVVTVLSSIITYAVTMKNELGYLEEDVKIINSEVNNVAEKCMNLQLESETHWGIISVRLKDIEKDIDEIKLDVKKLLAED